MWLRGVLRRRTARVIGLMLGVALAVAFLGALGAFFATAKANLTRQAVADVPVDWQLQLSTAANQSEVAGLLGQTGGVQAALPVAYADAAALHSTTAGSEQVTGAAVVLGLPPSYQASFPGEVRPLLGSMDGALLAQQTAANLHAAPGQKVTIELPGGATSTVDVAGIVDLPAADSLFQVVGAAKGAAPKAPPDNVLLLPASQWHQIYDPVAAARPESVHRQFHIRLARQLPADPVAAFAQVQGAALNLEAKLAGAGTVGDNLAVRLDAARTDAVYAQLLFLFLGLPGAVLAGTLTLLVGASGGDRRRAEQALLRVRGASAGLLLRMAGAEALAVGVIGAAVGIGAGLLAARAVIGTARLGSTPSQGIGWGVAAGAVGLLLATAAIVGPAWRDLRTVTVRRSQQPLAATGRPWWARVYLDVVLLVVAWLLYRRTLQQGYRVVLAPEGVPTVSVDYTTLFAPVFLWIGAALLAWRLSSLLLTRGRPLLARATRPVARRLASVVAASMSRQRRLLTRGLVLTALTASFGVSTALFNTTYAQQARVDAQLTNGADVTATTTATGQLPPDIAARARQIPGVAAAGTMQHRFAYVGNDLQDLYGIDPATIAGVTTISDAYFAAGHASAMLARLAAQPDALLVSAETVKDFQLQPGDLLRLRLQFAGDHAYHEVPFHYAGVVREFPTAPTDSFLVANAAYVAQATGASAGQTLLVKTSGEPGAVAAELRQAYPATSGLSVRDINTELGATLSGLTAVDLSGLTRIELGFALLLAMAATGLVFALGLAERRRTFAITSALGGRTRHLAAFIWSEALYVTIGGALLGAAAGWLLAQLLVTTLTGVFDPPPEGLATPWSFFGGLTAAAVLAVLAAGMWALRSTRRTIAELVRDL